MSTHGFNARPLAERFRLLTGFEDAISHAIIVRQADGLPTAQDERELANVRALLLECRRDARRISVLRKAGLTDSSEVPNV